MATYIGPNSRRFTQQGDRLRATSIDDLLFFTIQGAANKTTANPQGYGTFLSDINSIKKYTVTNLTTTDIGSIISVAPNGGLVGKGDSNSPIKLDREWLLDNYLPTQHMPISQLGSPTDFTLPIGGSYFSVTYPYNNSRRLFTSAFMERNGELRLLTHKTNGEELRVSYAFIPDPRNSNVIRNTDITYNPPGLKPGEFIGGVTPASTTAMLGEIWDSTGFKEWCFITLNGTFDHGFHSLIRMGRVLENIYGVNAFNIYRRQNAAVCIIGGKRYLFCGHERTTSLNVYGIISVYEVHEDGTITQIKNWKTVMSSGFTTQNENYVLGYPNMYVNSADELSGAVICPDDLKVVSIGASLEWFFTLGVPDKQGRVSLCMQYYFGNTSPTISSSSSRPVEVLVIDIDNHEVSARLLDPTDRRITLTYANAEHTRPLETNKVYGFNRYATGHFTATANWVVLLPYGIRVLHNQTINITSDIPSVTIFRNEGLNDYYDSLNYASLTTAPVNTGSYSLKLTPPTAIESGYVAFLIYNCLVQFNSQASIWMDFSPKIARINALSGGAKDHTYNVLDAALTPTLQPIKGYSLNSDRYTTTTSVWHSMNSFGRGSAVGYHNAVFTKVDGTGDSSPANNAFFNADGTPGNTKWKWTAELKTKVEAFISSIKNKWINADKYTEQFQYGYSLTPPFPGISNDMAMLVWSASYRDPTQELSVASLANAPVIQQRCMVPCTYTVDGNGNYTLTDITPPPEAQILITRNSTSIVYISAGGVRERSAAAFRYTSEYVDVTSLAGGYYSTFHGYDNNYLTQCMIQRFNATTAEQIIALYPGDFYIPTYSPALGLGVTRSNIGLGAFYGFYPVKDDLTLDLTNPTILGTARPSAGFSFTISSPIPLFTNGKLYEIPVQTIDLTTLFSNVKSKTFYLTAKVVNDAITLDITDTVPIQDSPTSFYIGSITTSKSEIIKIDALPTTRWESYRPSVNIRGSAIPVSPGTPHKEEETLWPIADRLELILDKNYSDVISTNPTDGYYPKKSVNLRTFVTNYPGIELQPNGDKINITIESDVAVIGLTLL